jgi:CheY-like chemotaxis protein
LILLTHGHTLPLLHIAAKIGAGISQLILFALMKNAVAPIRMLVVDDDTLSREVLALLLGHAGYAVEAVDSGDAAMRHLSTASGPPPDVVLADMQMPGTAGSALARKLRELCGAATTLLAMSGSMPQGDTIREFDGLLLKPFTIDELATAIAARGHSPATVKPVHQHLTALDETIYEKLSKSMRSERLEQLYDLSLNDAEKRIALMQKAASNKEEEAYRKQAHAIKGGCGMVGAVELQRLAASMEENGVDTNHVASLDELMTACKRLRRILIARKSK